MDGAPMALVEVLRARLVDGRAGSFQLMGEDLALLPGSSLRQAAEAYLAELERLPPALRPRFEAEQAAVLVEAHGWLRRYNRSLHGRLRGYLALARRCHFEYPWPVVAMLGICQVMTGLWRNRIYGLAAPALGRLGIGLEVLEQLSDGSDDVLRRTNRGIFADSVPTVLLGLRAYQLRRDGELELAAALLDGPLPPLMDGETRAVARALAEGLALADAGERFRALASLTTLHFAREQAIFTYHMAAPLPSPGRPHREPALVRRLLALRSVPAPVIVRRGGRREVAFRGYALPAGFDIRDHDARVEHFNRAFVTAVTSDPDDYRAASDYVTRRFASR